MKYFLVPFLTAFFLVNPVLLATIRNSDGSLSDTQTQINASSDGDTVLMAAGTPTWTGTLTITGKSVILKGAGGGTIDGVSSTSLTIGTGSKVFTTCATPLRWQAGQTIRAKAIKTAGSMTGTVTSYSGTTLTINVTSTSGSGTLDYWQFEKDGSTIITFNAAAGNGIDITKDNNGFIDIQDFDIVRGTATNSLINITEDAGQLVRIHDMRWAVGQSGSSVYGKQNGILMWNVGMVTDNTWPDGLPSPGAYYTASFIDIQFGLLNTTWQLTDTMGKRDVSSSTNFYVEDCTFVGFGLEGADFSDNAKLVFRHNILANSALTSHGPDTGTSGLRHFEINNNEWVYNGSSGACETAIVMDYFLYIRGGSGTVLTNVFPVLGDSCIGFSKVPIRVQLQALNRNSGPYPCWSGGYPMPHQHGQNYNAGSEVNWPICIAGNTGAGSTTPAANNYYGINQCSAADPPPVDIVNFFVAGQAWTNANPNTLWATGYVEADYPNTNRVASSGGGGSSVEGSKGAFNKAPRRGRR